jgi:hypothetical protein
MPIDLNLFLGRRDRAGESMTLAAAASEGHIVLPPEDFLYSCGGLRLSVHLRSLIGSFSFTWLVGE